MAKPVALTLALAGVMVAGCAGGADSKQPGVVRIQAPAGKCWLGTFGVSNGQGCGNKSITIKGQDAIVAHVQKSTPGLWPMRVLVVIDGKVKDSSQSRENLATVEVSE